MSTTIKLEYPVTLGNGEEIKSVTVRRPKGKDIKKMSKAPGNETEQGFAMLPDLTEQPPELFDEMDGKDIMAIMETVDGFLGKKGRRRSKTSTT